MSALLGEIITLVDLGIIPLDELEIFKKFIKILKKFKNAQKFLENSLKLKIFVWISENIWVRVILAGCVERIKK